MTREEAIERFNGIINAMSISIAQSKFYPSKAELDELCDMAIEALSADRPSGEWIPCSERLPKEKARVLTYDSMGDIVFGQYDKGRWYWEAEACADYWAKNDGVIAWMPLPKPYCPNCGAKMGGK